MKSWGDYLQKGVEVRTSVIEQRSPVSSRALEEGIAVIEDLPPRVPMSKYASHLLNSARSCRATGNLKDAVTEIKFLGQGTRQRKVGEWVWGKGWQTETS